MIKGDKCKAEDRMCHHICSSKEDILQNVGVPE